MPLKNLFFFQRVYPGSSAAAYLRLYDILSGAFHRMKEVVEIGGEVITFLQNTVLLRGTRTRQARTDRAVFMRSAPNFITGPSFSHCLLRV